MFADNTRWMGPGGLPQHPVAMRMAMFVRRAAAVADIRRLRAFQPRLPMLVRRAVAKADSQAKRASRLRFPTFVRRAIAIAEFLGVRASRPRFPIENLQPNGRLFEKMNVLFDCQLIKVPGNLQGGFIKCDSSFFLSAIPYQFEIPFE